MTESQILKATLDYLHLKKVNAWRNNTGAFWGEYQGRKRFVRFSQKGEANIIGCLPDGRFLAIECKRKGALLSDDQFHWLLKISSCGGVAFVADDIDYVMQRIDNILKEAP
jgi:hypothetical protein